MVDLTPIDVDPNTEDSQISRDGNDNVVCDANNPMPGRNDYINDTPGNDKIITGKAMMLSILAKEAIGSRAATGVDFVGQDVQDSSNDIIEGNAGADLLWGNGGNDQIYGEDKGEMGGYCFGGETAEGIDEQGDFLDGRDGDDSMYGSVRNDALSADRGQTS